MRAGGSKLGVCAWRLVLVTCASCMLAACEREAPAPAEIPAGEPRPAPVPTPSPAAAPPDRPGAPDPWAEARARGIDFRAVGQEPGWYLEIDHESQLRLVYDYAEREAVAAAPLPVVTDNQTAYAAATREHTVSVVSETRICRDAMSGAEYPATVTVRIDGRELHGCGRRLQ